MVGRVTDSVTVFDAPPYDAVIVTGMVPPTTRVVRSIAPSDPIENILTVSQIRDQSVAPRRLNAALVSSFGGLAVLIAAVGIAGVLAFSVSARTREFGIRLAIGSAPGHLLKKVLSEGAVIAGVGIVAGALGGLLLTRVAVSIFGGVEMPGIASILGAAVLLVAAAIIASLLPASRASARESIHWS